MRMRTRGSKSAVRLNGALGPCQLCIIGFISRTLAACLGPTGAVKWPMDEPRKSTPSMAFATGPREKGCRAPGPEGPLVTGVRGRQNQQ